MKNKPHQCVHVLEDLLLFRCQYTESDIWVQWPIKISVTVFCRNEKASPQIHTELQNSYV